MEVKKYLKQIRKLDLIIQNKVAEKQRWLDAAMSTTVSTEGERVKSSGSQQKMADAIDNYIDIGREVDEIIRQRAKEREEIIATLEQLPAKDVLHKIYVQYMTFSEVADSCGNSYSWATTVHGRALKNLQKILDDRERKDEQRDSAKR